MFSLFNISIYNRNEKIGLFLMYIFFRLINFYIDYLTHLDLFFLLFIALLIFFVRDNYFFITSSLIYTIVPALYSASSVKKTGGL